METAKNKKIFNVIMIAVIAVIIIGGILIVGSIKKGDGGFAVADKLYGIINVERAGISFELEKGKDLQSGDKITVNEKAGLTIKSEKNTYELSENSVVLLKGEKNLELELSKGEMFIIDDENGSKLVAQNNEISSQNSVFSVNVQTGSMGIKVFSGEVRANVNGKTVIAKSGETISIVGTKAEVLELTISSLNSFNLEKAIEASGKYKLCFTEKELKKVIEEREEEVSDSEDDAKENGVVSKGEEKGASNSSSNDNQQTGDNNVTTPEEPKLKCTIEIRCDTILNNMDNLTSGKEGYVPSNGTILKTTTVEFTEGETVFDVLKRVCSSKGIHLEYSWSPIYSSQYIEGINHLYEFDCGNLSGWCYKVNGWAPNYGVSVYELKDGDSIKFLYSCEGAGADVGA